MTSGRFQSNILLSHDTPTTHCFQTHAKCHIQWYKQHQVGRDLKGGKLRGFILMICNKNSSHSDKYLSHSDKYLLHSDKYLSHTDN